MDESVVVAERRARIVAEVNGGSGESSRALSEALGVSVDTVQRDLVVLERRGSLRRVRGGAAPVSPQPANYAVRAGTADDVPKRAIADVAAGLIEPGSVVAVTGGTTMTFLADSLSYRATDAAWMGRGAGQPLAVFTTNLAAAPVLATIRGVTVALPGGAVHPPSNTLVGADAVDAARALRPDQLFVSACSLHPQDGLTMQHREESQVVRALIEGSRSVVVMVTADRLGSVAPYLTSTCDAIDVVISDAPAVARRPFAEFTLDWRTA